MGKTNQGISEAIRPHLKFDTTGMGHDPAKDFNDRLISFMSRQAGAKLPPVTPHEREEGPLSP